MPELHKPKFYEVRHQPVEPDAEELAALLRALVLGGTDADGKLPPDVFAPGGFIGLVGNVRDAMDWLKRIKNDALRTQRIIALMKANRLAIRFGPDKHPNIADQPQMHVLEIPEDD